MHVSEERRRIAAQIGLIERHHGPDDPRLTGLRCYLTALGVEEIGQWVEAAEAELPDLDEVRLARRRARRVLCPGGDAA